MEICSEYGIRNMEIGSENGIRNIEICSEYGNKKYEFQKNGNTFGIMEIQYGVISIRYYI